MAKYIEYAVYVYAKREDEFRATMDQLEADGIVIERDWKDSGKL